MEVTCIKYGLIFTESLDVYNKVKELVRKSIVIISKLRPNSVFGDPYRDRKKILFIQTKEFTYKFQEYDNRLKSNNNEYLYWDDEKVLIANARISIEDGQSLHTQSINQHQNENNNENENENKRYENGLSILNSPTVMDKSTVNRHYPFTHLHKKIMPFAIYFPQFHEFEENNVNFYPGYNDIKNLKLLIQSHKKDVSSSFELKRLNPQGESPTQDYELLSGCLRFDSTSKTCCIKNYETPASNLYGSNDFDESTDISDYDLLKNPKIIHRQVELARAFGICGFAMYYYWFSKNTITGTHMLMKPVIDRFFQEDLGGFNVYFVWANENWTKNAAFGTSNHKIENNYDTQSLSDNIKCLMPYFKHRNYLKIDNKPVLAIHHPWFMTMEEIDKFKMMLDKACREEDDELGNAIHFDGIHILCNSMAQRYPNYINYQFHPNYKTWKSRTPDYKEYFKTKLSASVGTVKSDIQSIFFDFDNSARLFRPDKLHLKTQVCNNTEENISNVLKELLKYYNIDNRSEISKIFLINAWNEWGEKMHIEPSNENGTKKLESFLDILLSTFKD